MIIDLEKLLQKACIWRPKPRPAFVRRYGQLPEMQQLKFTWRILGHLQVPSEHKAATTGACRGVIGAVLKEERLRTNIPTVSNVI
jgi:hypothetical protein